mmetsp:Transcript_17516/g.43683  ORF Transcript_17516/g.43683 Transcript_17516/m.43683 type:complete len:155 (-) Transcript_17516:208-672(-)
MAEFNEYGGIQTPVVVRGTKSRNASKLGVAPAQSASQDLTAISPSHKRTRGEEVPSVFPKHQKQTDVRSMEGGEERMIITEEEKEAEKARVHEEYMRMISKLPQGPRSPPRSLDNWNALMGARNFAMGKLKSKQEAYIKATEEFEADREKEPKT